MKEDNVILVRYLNANMRRMLKLCPVIIAGFVILSVSILLGVKIFLADNIDGSGKKLKIGVVGDINNEFFESGLTAMGSMDATRYIIDIVPLSLKEAETKIYGELTAYMIIPEGFVEAVMYGRNNERITYVTGESSKGFTSIIMEEIVNTFSNYITSSQSAIYASSKLKNDNGMGDLSDTELFDINVRCINTVLGREKMCDVELIGIGNSLSVTGYYFCGLTVLMFMLSGISCCMYFNRRSRNVWRLLYAKGYSEITQIVCEYVPFLLVSMLSAVIIWIVLSVLVGGGSFVIEQWDEESLAGMWLYLPKVIPVLLLVTSVQIFIYELTDNLISSILLQFIISIGMGYVSGCFYPKQFFPDMLQTVGELLPAGISMKYMSLCMLGDGITGSLFYMIILFAVIFGGTVLVRRYRMQGEIT